MGPSIDTFVNGVCHFVVPSLTPCTVRDVLCKYSPDIVHGRDVTASACLATNVLSVGDGHGDFRYGASQEGSEQVFGDRGAADVPGLDEEDGEVEGHDGSTLAEEVGENTQAIPCTKGFVISCLMRQR